MSARSSPVRGTLPVLKSPNSQLLSNDDNKTTTKTSHHPKPPPPAPARGNNNQRPNRQTSPQSSTSRTGRYSRGGRTSRESKQTNSFSPSSSQIIPIPVVISPSSDFGPSPSIASITNRGQRQQQQLANAAVANSSSSPAATTLQTSKVGGGGGTRLNTGAKQAQNLDEDGLPYIELEDISKLNETITGRHILCRRHHAFTRLPKTYWSMPSTAFTATQDLTDEFCGAHEIKPCELSTITDATLLIRTFLEKRSRLKETMREFSRCFRIVKAALIKYVHKRRRLINHLLSEWNAKEKLERDKYRQALALEYSGRRQLRHSTLQKMAQRKSVAPPSPIVTLAPPPPSSGNDRRMSRAPSFNSSSGAGRGRGEGSPPSPLKRTASMSGSMHNSNMSVQELQQHQQTLSMLYIEEDDKREIILNMLKKAAVLFHKRMNQWRHQHAKHAAIVKKRCLASFGSILSLPLMMYRAQIPEMPSYMFRAGYEDFKREYKRRIQEKERQELEEFRAALDSETAKTRETLDKIIAEEANKIRNQTVTRRKSRRFDVDALSAFAQEEQDLALLCGDVGGGAQKKKKEERKGGAGKKKKNGLSGGSLSIANGINEELALEIDERWHSRASVALPPHDWLDACLRAPPPPKSHRFAGDKRGSLAKFRKSVKRMKVERRISMHLQEQARRRKQSTQSDASARSGSSFSMSMEGDKDAQEKNASAFLTATTLPTPRNNPSQDGSGGGGGGASMLEKPSFSITRTVSTVVDEEAPGSKSSQRHQQQQQSQRDLGGGVGGKGPTLSFNASTAKRNRKASFSTSVAPFVDEEVEPQTRSINNQPAPSSSVVVHEPHNHNHHHHHQQQLQVATTDTEDYAHLKDEDLAALPAEIRLNCLRRAMDHAIGRVSAPSAFSPSTSALAGSLGIVGPRGHHQQQQPGEWTSSWTLGGGGVSQHIEAGFGSSPTHNSNISTSLMTLLSGGSGSAAALAPQQHSIHPHGPQQLSRRHHKTEDDDDDTLLTPVFFGGPRIQLPGIQQASSRQLTTTTTGMVPPPHPPSMSSTYPPPLDHGTRDGVQPTPPQRGNENAQRERAQLLQQFRAPVPSRIGEKNKVEFPQLADSRNRVAGEQLHARTVRSSAGGGAATARRPRAPSHHHERYQHKSVSPPRGKGRVKAFQERSPRQ